MNGDEPKTIRLVEDRWTVLRHVIEAAAIVTAGLWAFYTFVYQEKLRPAAEPAALTPTISIQRLGRDRKREILDVTIRLANTGRTDLDIAADAWNIWGYRYASSVSKRETLEGG
ncbi:MAG: hypothetical protein JOZ24_04410, partial [Candidatus Eremiobacteraeota bacterium]|nr:hypothetical protein [Candidatus Eremiobacteraeota bacterium]